MIKMKNKFKILLKCTYCNKEFLRYKCWIKKNNSKHFFCSLKCKSIWQSINCKGANSPVFKGGIESRKKYCIDCGKELSKTAYYKGYKRCRSCSKKGIYSLFFGMSLKGEQNPNFKGGKPKCIDCGKQLKDYTSIRCCSCARKEQYKDPKNHPQWQGGKSSLYTFIHSLGEYKNWRNLIFKRDNYTCQECGQYGSKLNVHHKTPFAELLQEFLNEYNQFSPIEDKETLVRLAIKWKPFWNIDNGITLCEDCHKEEHKNLKLKLLKEKDNDRLQM